MTKKHSAQNGANFCVTQLQAYQQIKKQTSNTKLSSKVDASSHCYRFCLLETNGKGRMQV